MNTEAHDTTPTIAAWRSGDLILQPAQRRLLRGEVAVDVEDRVFDLIALLAQNHERALDQREVTLALWGQRPVSEGTLRQLVYKARRALGDDGDHQTMIRSRRGAGLQWIAPLEPVYAEAVAAAEFAPVHALSTVPIETLAPPRRQRRWLPMVAAAVLSLTAVGLWVNKARAPEDAPPPRVAIEPFVNATGDASLDWIKNGLPGLLGSLVEQGGGLDVVNAAQVAHAWAYKPQQGRSHEQQLRFVTGADVLVGGKLTKLADKLYELNLQVQTADGTKDAIQIEGEQPGILAADAVARVRRQLGLASVAPLVGKLPSDPFLAEAFARGMDLASQGKWADARTYYAVCVKGDPDFLQARIDLAAAQIHTDDLQGGEKALKDILTSAQHRDAARSAGRALSLLANLEANRGQAALALDHMQQAIPYAHRSGDVDVEIQAHLTAAWAASTLNKPNLSARELNEGKHLLAKHPNFRRAQSALYDTAASIASSKGDNEGSLAARRAALTLRESLGDEHDIVVSLNNLAMGLYQAHRLMESLTIATRAYIRASDGHYRALAFDTAANLSSDLLDLGLARQMIKLNDRVLILAQQENSKPWQILVLLRRGAAQLMQGNANAALTTAREVNALIIPGTTNSDVYIFGQMLEAKAAFLADPKALTVINTRFDAFVAAHRNDPGYRDDPSYPRRQQLLHALVCAAAKQPEMALASLQAAQTVKYPDGVEDSGLREIALMIALADGDKAAASIGLTHFDVATSENARLLSLYIPWARHEGADANLELAETRLVQLRKTAQDALAASGIDLDHAVAKQ